MVDLEMVRALPDVAFEEDAEDALPDVAVLAVELVAPLLAEALGVNTTRRGEIAFSALPFVCTGRTRSLPPPAGS